LRQDALNGRATPVAHAIEQRQSWPEAVRAFWESGELERFGTSGIEGDRIEFLRRQDRGVDVFTRDLHGIRMEQVSAEVRQTRALVDSLRARDLRRGFTLTLLLLLAGVWLVSLAPLIFLAHRVSRPIQQLTAGLTDFARGDWNRRVETTRDDEVGRAVEAFNHMAEQLRQSRERLVHLTQMASWQSLARKTAHEVKNSLTPIRLTVEEMLARQPPADRAFMDQAVQIVVSEIDSLERRVRAFSDLASEPPSNPEVLDVNALVSERVSLLKPAHPKTAYHLRHDGTRPHVRAGADLVKGIRTNLLQNAAEAAGPDGSVLVVTRPDASAVVVEVHDSGPGLSDESARTLFEPTITFKKNGMGLGLSIAKRNALLSNGDITLIAGELGGAAFRVTLPAPLA
jgi:nitrogen fixation/metabolism regulation signal transduction histidine kinase